MAPFFCLKYFPLVLHLMSLFNLSYIKHTFYGYPLYHWNDGSRMNYSKSHRLSNAKGQVLLQYCHGKALIIFC